MKNKIKRHIIETLIAAVFIGSAIFLSGCLSPSTNPVYNPVSPSASIPQYLPNTNTQVLLSDAGTVAPLLPSPFNGVAEAALGIYGVLSTAFAAYKNSQANKNSSQLQSVLAAVNSINHPQTVAAVKDTVLASS